MTHKNTFIKKQIWIVGCMMTLVAVAAAQKQPSVVEFDHAMQLSMTRMDSGMKSAPMNGNVDHDFAAMMMPHHEGAIDMAKVELIYGKDPVMRRLAEEIVVDQQSEIEAMQLWLSKKWPSAHKPLRSFRAPDRSG
jgi:uncharacterized protein (DUF305 family)